MKNILLIAFLLFSMYTFSTCKKEKDAPVPPTPEKTFIFPFTVKQYKIEQEGPIKVYKKTGGYTKEEMTNYNPKILEEPIFKTIGQKIFQSISFSSKGLGEFLPSCSNPNNDLYIIHNGQDFIFNMNYYTTDCAATGSGDYDDLSIDCQASVLYSRDGHHYFNDFARDACWTDQAFDCLLNDTVAILNYKIYLKKD